jgi:sugar fermentation stimulation protein A
MLYLLVITFNYYEIKYFKNRYKRFFIEFTDDTVGYCPNTGKMSDLLIPNSPCFLSPNTAKLPLKLEAINIDEVWIGTNTHNPNKLASTLLKEIFPNENFKVEVKFGQYRCDFASSNKIIEVKYVHWKIGDTAYFPDCIAVRGARQMLDLINLSTKYECYVIYILQRNDCEKVQITSWIDKDYYNNSCLAMKYGIIMKAFNCNISPGSISINKAIEILP